MERAQYIIVSNVQDKPLVIQDIGPWDSFPTVTNAAETVVAELVASKHLTEGRRLLYYDSEGELDEIVVQNGRFAGFKCPASDIRGNL
jgi:hypothetical protein